MSRFSPGFLSADNGNDQYTKILLHMDGVNGGTSFLDVNIGGSAHTWTASSATTVTASPKFGTANYSSSGGNISTPDHADFILGSSDFTIDYWMRTTTATGNVLGQGNSTGATQSVLATVGIVANKISMEALQGGATYRVISTTSITTGAWFHIEFCRYGNVLKLFVNGTQEGGDVAFTGAVNTAAFNWAIGRHGERAAGAYVGEIDEFRLSVGIARHTANFTPPTSAYS